MPVPCWAWEAQRARPWPRTTAAVILTWCWTKNLTDTGVPRYQDYAAKLWWGDFGLMVFGSQDDLSVRKRRLDFVVGE